MSSSPDELWSLNLSNAASYRFRQKDLSCLGPLQALETLKRDACHLAHAKWVDNHWSMILWKLAGEILAKPLLYDAKWTWDEVLHQLKYRCVYRNASCPASIPDAGLDMSGSSVPLNGLLFGGSKSMTRPRACQWSFVSLVSDIRPHLTMTEADNPLLDLTLSSLMAGTAYLWRSMTV